MRAADESSPSVTGQDPGEHSGEVLYECRNVSVSFASASGSQTPLADVNFDIRRGEFVSVVGASGSGKTTLLRVMGGLVEPGPGSSVRFQGHPVLSPPVGVVFVFQDYRASLLPWRTVHKNVSLGLEPLGVARTERRKIIDEALDLVGLSGRGQDFPWQLSGGMQQRVQLARALAVSPGILLMDEPFGALDAMTKGALQDEILRLRAMTDTSIVFVTHDIDEAVYLSDRVLVLNGRPANIAAEVPVPIGLPRSQVETRSSPAFIEARRQVYSSLEQ